MGQKQSTKRETLMAILAFFSIGLLVAEYIFALSPEQITLIYTVDLTICIIFAIDFSISLSNAAKKGAFLKWHSFEILAMVPAFAFSYLETSTIFGAGLRSLRLIRVVRFFAVSSRISRSKVMAVNGRDKDKKISKRRLIRNGTVAAVVGSLYLIFRNDIAAIPQYGRYIDDILISAFVIALAFVIAEAASIYATSKIDDYSSRQPIDRIIKLVIVGLSIVGVVSLIFEELLILAFSLGVVGLILSFSLSPIISNFISWIYISAKKPFSIGDIVEIGEKRGIVNNIGYFTTTLLEFGGDQIVPGITGRRITVPNSMVLSEVVATFSKKASPVTTKTITFNIAYESDLDKVREIILKCINEYTAARFAKMAEYCETEDCDVLFVNQIKAGPRVVFAPSQSWIEVKAFYPAVPALAALSVSDITELILREFNLKPEAVKFPQSRSR